MRTTLIIFILLIIQSATIGQINLEKSFVTESSESITYNLNPIYKNLLLSEVVGYSLYDSRNSDKLELYNINYNLNSSITITIPDGYEIVGYGQFSKYLFNNNDNVEFTIMYKKIGEQKYITQIRDEKNNTLLDLDGYVSTSCFLVSNNFKMRALYLTSLNGNNEYREEIYSLGGNVSSYSQTIKSSIISNPYPNPANSIINIPYVLQGINETNLMIFNVHGQLVDSKKIYANSNEFKLDVQNYPIGLYIYEYNGITKKFIVH